MPLKVSCAKCGGVLHAPDDAGGKKGKCPNCGNILPIPLDAPKVTDSMGGGAGPLEGLPVTSAVGSPVPRPAEPRGFGATAAVPASSAGRTSVDPKPFAAAPSHPYTDPPRSAARPAPVPPAAPFTTTSASSGGKKAWSRVRRGLWWVRTGVVLFVLAGLLTGLLAASGSLGIRVPDKDPGYLGIDRVSSLGEFYLAVGFVPFALGCLAVVLGRLGVADAPAASGARGTALWAAVFGAAAFAGLVGLGLFLGGQIFTGSSPNWIPTHDIESGVRVVNGSQMKMNVQDRVTHYVNQILLPPDEISGAVSRFGLLGFVVFGVLGQSWFLGAVGRIGSNLQDRRTCFRATLACWYCSVAAAAAAFIWLTYVIYGEADLRTVFEKWFNLAPGVKGGVVAVVGLVGAVLYIRMLNAARTAVAARIG